MAGVTYEIQGPDGTTYEVTAPEGASEEEVLAYAQRQFAAAPAEQPPGPGAAHYGGLTARVLTEAVPQAVLGLPALAMDAYDSLVNLQNTGINALGKATGLYNSNFRVGQPFENTRNLAQGSTALADAIGLPKPQTETQQKAVQYGTSISSALGGAGLSGMAAKALAKGTANAAPAMVAPISTLPGVRQSAARIPGLMAEYPGQQVAGAAGSTYAANMLAQNPDLTKDLGAFRPLADASMVLGAGMLAPSAVSSMGNVGNRSLQVVRPFSEAGQRGIAGTILRQFATDPDQAAANLGRNQSQILPGSRMTTGEVSGDAGLAGAQQPILKAMDGRNLAGQRASERNEARVTQLDRLAGENFKAGQEFPINVRDYAKNKRSSEGNVRREAAFGASTVTPDTLNSATTLAVESTINRILGGEKGTRSDVRSAMDDVRTSINQNIDTPERLYSIRKDLRDASLGKYDKDKPALKLAKGELEEVIKTIDDVLDSAAPGYKGYMAKYSQQSKAIDQMEIFKHLRDSASSASVDITRSGGAAAQFPVMMAGKLKAALNSNMMQKEGVKLSDQQQKILDKVFADLRSEMTISGGNRMTKQPGSDTFKNMTTANVMGHIMGDYLGSTQAAKTITAPMQWIYKLPENKVADLLVESILDPKLARELIGEASTIKIQRFSEAMKVKAAAQGLIQQSDLIPE